MLSQSNTNSYIPSEAAVPSPSFTLDAFPGGRRQSSNASYNRHSRERSPNTENIHRHQNAPTASIKKDRRKTIDCGLARLPVALRNDSIQQAARILPQRIITPRSATGVQSIWFQSKSGHPDPGASLADVVEHGAEGLVVAPEERVFEALSLDHNEIQFYILWPGYGHISWIASIPTEICERGGRQYGPLTRGLLAVVVAQHFQAFMTNHSYLRFPHPDPNWKIMNDRESGIRFEDLRLTRLFSHKDDNDRLSSWQAEILVVDNPSTHAHRRIP